MFSPLPESVPPDIYLNVFVTATTNRDFIASHIRLSSISQLIGYLTTYAPGHLISISDMCEKWLKGRLTETLNEDRIPRHPIWLAEYTHKESKKMYLDIIDAESEGQGQRLGIICLGANPEEDPWEFIKGKTNITVSFYQEVESAEEVDKDSIDVV